jgi:hypothetical protein
MSITGIGPAAAAMDERRPSRPMRHAIPRWTCGLGISTRRVSLAGEMPSAGRIVGEFDGLLLGRGTVGWQGGANELA